MPGVYPAPRLERSGTGGAGAKHAPAGSVYELQLLVEGHLLEYEISTAIGG